MTEFTGQGFGKTILFGEHFVVYGLPAIASGIGAKTLATIKSGQQPGYQLTDERPAAEGYKTKKFEQQKESFQLMFKKMNFNPQENPIEIWLGGDLPAMSGTGASAASCVALARALSQFQGKNLTEEEINAIGYEGEKGYHGNPSGLDNTASTYGKLLWFKKTQPPTIELLETQEPINLIIADTGKVADTKEVVGKVREQKEKEPEKYEKLFADYEALALEAKQAITDFDLKKIGQLMNQNNQLLKEMNLECEEARTIIETALTNGALGAKVSGTGQGGVVVSLYPDQKTRDKAAAVIQDQGFKAIATTIGR